MLVSEEVLMENITKNLTLCLNDPNKLKDLEEQLASKYNIPRGQAADLISLKQWTSGLDLFILYALSDILKFRLEDYFTTNEISNFQGKKYKRHTVNREFQAVKVADDQYLCVISAKELMEYRDEGIIQYNKDTQRPLIYKRMKNNGMEYYVPDVSWKQVKQIENAIANGEYIPDTITLGIPEYAELKYVDGILTIPKQIKIGIIDGYHRYLALCNVYNINHDLDINIEIRIVQFSSEKANQFVWQENQKYVMKKSVSDSLNKNDEHNKIVDYLNQFSIIKGLIGMENKSMIKYNVLLAGIKEYFSVDKKKQMEVLETRKDLKNKIEFAISEYPEMLQKQWSNGYTIAFLYLISKDRYDDLDNMCKKADKITINVDSIRRNWKNSIKEVYRDV